jgi:hypothetical protein
MFVALAATDAGEDGMHTLCAITIETACIEMLVSKAYYFVN